ncbi:MAG: foldase protein PrsA [Lachnospiraceae bacterium]
MKNNSVKCLRRAAVCLLLSVSLAGTWGCGKAGSDGHKFRVTVPLSDDVLFKMNGEECSMNEAMILAAAQKKVVEAVYGQEIWAINAGESTIEDVTKSALQSALSKMYTMDLMAEKYEIQPSDADQAALDNCINTYMGYLTDEEKKESGVTEEQVRKVYTAYYTSQTLVDRLTEDMVSDISDDQAKVVRAEQIYIKKTDEDRTEYVQDLLARAKEAKEEDDFLTLARSYNEKSKEEITVMRGDLPKAAEEALFSMRDGEISDIIEVTGGYFIFHCTEDYDAQATAENKRTIARKQREADFIKQYEEFIGSLSAQFNKEAWEKVTMADVKVPEAADFFSIYENVFK